MTFPSNLSTIAWPTLPTDRLAAHRREVCALVVQCFEVDEEPQSSAVSVDNDQGDTWNLRWTGEYLTITGERYTQEVRLELIFESHRPVLYDATGTNVNGQFVGRLQEDDPDYLGPLHGIYERFDLREALDGRTPVGDRLLESRPRARL